MSQFILLMHDDTVRQSTDAMWDSYFARLRALDAFDGGSSIGGGVALRDGAPAAALTTQITGFIRVRAHDLVAAQALVAGNPIFECGGTIEVRELLRD
ncbi:MAG: hypothetical protein ACRCUI_10260 [Polymorphobacter sp.]